MHILSFLISLGRFRSLRHSRFRGPSHSGRGRTILPAILAAILAAAFPGGTPAGLAGAAAPEEEESAIPFALGAPVIVKADWRSDFLRAADFNGDGRTDFLTVNNSKGLLEIFLQNPEGEKEPFTKREEILDFRVDDVAAADFNADGKTDLAIASRNRNLLLRCQKADGTFRADLSLDAQALYVRAADLDGDGIADLVALAEDKMTILYGPILLPGKTPDEAPIPASNNSVSFFNAATPAGTPLIGDFDGDGLDDLAYGDAQRRNQVLVRLQTSARQWGLESSFETANVAGATVLRSAPRSAKTGQEAETPADRLVVVDFTTRELRLYRFQEDAMSVQQNLPLNGPYFLSYDPKSLTGQETVAAADLQGSGTFDLVSASAKAAELNLYVQDERGRLRALTAPSLSNITALAVVPRAEGDLVFSLSDKEETIGASAWDPVRGLSVPAVFDARRKPLAMAAGDLQGDGKKDLLFLYKGADEKIALGAFENPAGVEALREGALTTRALPVEKDFEPTGMTAADLNGDNRCDLLVFQKYNPIKLLLQEADGSFRGFATEEGMKKGIFNKVQPSQVQISDLDGDGRNEMLIARENFARAYRIEEGDELRLVEQFNGKNASAVIGSIAVADLDGDGDREVVLLDSGNQVLTIYRRNESGQFAAVRHHEVEGLRAARLLAVDANHDGRDDLLTCEEGRPQLYYSGGNPMVFKPIWRRAPEEKKQEYASVWGLDLLGAGAATAGEAATGEAAAVDGQARTAAGEQLLALEGTEHLLEFFAVSAADPEQPARFFHFKMFDDERSVSQSRDLPNRAEPRDVLALDVNGDGLRDLIALVHDNILYYPQQKPAGEPDGATPTGK